MNVGKVSNSLLEKLIGNINKREEVLIGSEIGRDTAILDFKEKLIVLSTDPITGTGKDIGTLAINVSVNDLATQGAEPVAAMLTILAPPETKEEELVKVMEDAKLAASKINLSIVGGHTEITDAVKQIIISSTVLGMLDAPLVERKLETNDLVVVTKTLGIEGTGIIAKERAAEIKKFLKKSEIDEAFSYLDNTSVIKDGLIAKKYGAKYMHDITEGGVLGAVWEASKANDSGIIIFSDKLPTTDVTEKICKYFKIDANKLVSSGSMLIIISMSDYNKLSEEFERENIRSTIIGRVADFDGAYIRKNGKLKLIAEPKSDELYKVV